MTGPVETEYRDRREETQSVALEFFARSDQLAGVRKLILRRAAKTLLGKEEIEDFLTAVDEATANAIRHGSPRGERSLIKVVCYTLPTALIVEVQDQGQGFVLVNAAVMPGPDAPGGRGLPLMCALADTVEIASNAKGTTITLKKGVRSAGEESVVTNGVPAEK